MIKKKLSLRGNLRLLSISILVLFLILETALFSLQGVFSGNQNTVNQEVIPAQLAMENLLLSISAIFENESNILNTHSIEELKLFSNHQILDTKLLKSFKNMQQVLELALA